MPRDPSARLAIAQRGIALVDVMPGRSAASRARGARSRGAAALTGPFLSPGSLTTAERKRLLEGIERVLDGVYTHLPLKRARYGFDPIQRLRILRTQITELSDEAFHIELADVVTRLRDAHTRYSGPRTLEDKVAALPFLVEMCGPVTDATYIVTKVGDGLAPTFKPGVVLEYWNGVPIDRAVQRHSDQEVGGRPDSQRAASVASLTLRSLQYGPPPDEHWVVVGYSTVGVDGEVEESREIKIPWTIVDPSEIETFVSKGSRGKRARALRLARAVDPAAEAIRRARMLLFAPHALTGQQAQAPPRAVAEAKSATATRSGTIATPLTSTIINTRLTETLKVMSIDAPGGPFGYLRIYGFDAEPERFMRELRRLIRLLPERGLIIDVRGNPGGYIWAAEFALQLFTPHAIEPTRFSALATPFTRQVATIGTVAEDLAPWRESLAAAVRNGELYAQTIPMSDPADCNNLGQHYGGPVMLVGDSNTYSAGDLFCAGFVDNGMGPFLCVGGATGAGGANVWSYGEMRLELDGSDAALPRLPDGIDLSFSFRRATRARASEGLVIEDVGVEGQPVALTRNDLLNGNPDLLATCIAVLETLPFSRLSATISKRTRAVRIVSSGLDRLDALFDGHPGTSQPLSPDATIALPYPARTKVIDLIGFSAGAVRQRRRLSLRRHKN